MARPRRDGLGGRADRTFGPRVEAGAPGGLGNHRNGSTGKTVQTEFGPVAVKAPRDRAGTFEPQLVAKRQTRLVGLEEKILGRYAGGIRVKDIEARLGDLYGV